MVKLRIQGADVLQKKIKEYGKAANKESGVIIQGIAKSGSRYLANNTRPFGVSNSTRDILNKAVLKDMHRVYIASDKSKSRDDGTHLEESRTRNGRVTRKQKPYFITPDSFEEIYRAKIKNVGTAKEGWFDSAKDLEGKQRPPKWLNKQIVLGDSEKKHSGLKTVISLTNRCRYAFNLISNANIQKSLGLAYKNYIRFIDTAMAKLKQKEKL